MPDTDRLTALAGLLGRSHHDMTLVDPADLFDLWLVAETESSLALAAWRVAPDDEKAAAYGAYLASLDREDSAAERLEQRLRIPS